MMTAKSEYSGGAYHVSLPHGKATGKVRLSNFYIEFQEGEIQLRLPIQGLQIRKGGVGNRSILFNNTQTPELTIFSEDETILDSNSLQGNTKIFQQIENLRSGKWKIPIIFLTFGLAVVAFISLLTKLKEPFVVIVANSIPIGWEQTLGGLVFEQLVKDKRTIK